MLMQLRDRDSVVLHSGVIMRVLGYTHPSSGWICEPEYTPPSVFKSRNPRAPRGYPKTVYYKLYGSEPMELIEMHPELTVVHPHLNTRVPGAPAHLVKEARRPEEGLRAALSREEDELTRELRRIVELIEDHTQVSIGSLGVFGSIQHGFHHPKLSDIDLTVIGLRNARELAEFLEEAYRDPGIQLEQEYRAWLHYHASKPFWSTFLTPGEHLWHQLRKPYYAVYTSWREIKVEFHPVKGWSEVRGEPLTIRRVGEAKAKLEVIDDTESIYIPSVWLVEPVEGPPVERVVSYIEDFKMQAKAGETIIAAGVLEEVKSPARSYLQITVTQNPRLHAHGIKVAR
ncbi:MAG: hypothetical protein DRN99_03470 [Thermoproteota archaeon]|nr:MAG: hypothetical protein DRN99_03470 [Candidatus Korarchaeota archaeon]